jgi:hypothetical protein
LIAVRDAIYRLDNDIAAGETVSRAWRSRDESLLLSARLELLFGPTSDAARAATSMTSGLARAIDQVQPPKRNVQEATGFHLDARARLTELQQAAFEDIRHASPPSARIRDAVRKGILRW